jgi:hypothetical protein
MLIGSGTTDLPATSPWAREGVGEAQDQKEQADSASSLASRDDGFRESDEAGIP